MRTFFLATLLCVFDLAFGANYPPAYYIPAGGQTINNLTYFQVASQNFYVSTTGSVALGANTYTLTYAALPPANTTWNVIFDATNLTVTTATNVNLFGETPLATYTPVKKFYINFSVVYVAGTPTKLVKYFSSLDDLKTFTQAVTFSGVITDNARANFNDTVKVYGGKFYLAPVSGITTGQTVVAGDTLGKFTFGCTPWCTTGNIGLVSTANFLGTTDTAGINFRLNNYPSGRLDYNLSNIFFGYGSGHGNTTGTQNIAIGTSSQFLTSTGAANVALGANTLGANTTGGSNTTVGTQASPSNTTGNQNTSIGYAAGQGNTTGTSNTNLGYQSGYGTTTGSTNIGIGVTSLATLTTGSNNIGVGYGADVSATSTHDATAIGNHATAGNYGVALGGVTASNNTLAIYPRSLYLPNATTAIRYVLTDTSGTGNFVPQPLPVNQQTKVTPVTGDSTVISTGSNLIKPAGTIANYTIILPASPYSGQLLEFSFTQIVTALHWSVALNQAVTAAATLPSATTAGSTAKIMYNSNDATWYNW